PRRLTDGTAPGAVCGARLRPCVRRARPPPRGSSGTPRRPADARLRVGAFEPRRLGRRLRPDAPRAPRPGARGDGRCAGRGRVEAVSVALRLMAFRVLTQHEVERLLPMEECVELMAEALAALARREVFNPLRFVVRPPGEETLMGLMPAHRAQPAPVYALKTVCIVPANPARGLDAHQGSVTLFDGDTGEVRAVMNA